jgi:hypothetical protein
MKSPWLVGMIAASLGCGPAVAGACLGDSAESRYLPRVIGRPYSTLRTSYKMPCDTMEVRIGDTCTIYPGMLMHFGSVSNPDNRIHIRGRLEVLGSDEAPVNFSGTLSEGDFGIKPGTGAWGGFEVDPVGEVVIRNARIFRATPIMRSQSERVSFSKVLLRQSLDLLGPNGNFFPVDFKETRIDSLDFGAPIANHQSQDTVSRPSARADSSKSSAGKSVWAWSLAGGGALLLGGGLWWYLDEKGPSTGHPNTDTDVHYPPKPNFPDAGP